MREAHEDVTLAPEADRALRLVLRRDVEVASSCLRQLQAGEPVAAVCINLTLDESLAVPDLYVVRADEFRRAVEKLDDPEQWMDLWNPAWYPEEDWVETPLVEDAEFAAAERVLLEALEPLVIDAYRWVMLRVARELNAAPPIPLAEDGVIYVLNWEFSDLLLDQLRFVAPADTFARLRRRGLIGEP
jgi:hypothetical protein